MPGQKLYIVTTTELVQAVQRQPKVLAFPPIQAQFANQVCGVGTEARNILQVNVNGDEGDWGLSMESYAALRAALSPGADLDRMNRIMVENVAEALDDIVPTNQSTRVYLVDWIRGAITLATTNSVYGPQNPFTEKGIIDSFWYVQPNLQRTW